MRQIELRALDGSVRAITQVDDAEFAVLSQWRWCYQKGYAGRMVKRPHPHVIQMHRLIMGLLPGDPRVVDHIDRDPLNNQRANLRVCTRAQNNQNRDGLSLTNPSGYRGVTLCKQTMRWRARVKLAGRTIHLGRFDTPEEAAEVVRQCRLERMSHATC